MKNNIAIVDPSGRISGLLDSMGMELDATVHRFESNAELAEAINRKEFEAAGLQLLILCIVNQDENHPVFRATLSLAGQLRKHSKFSAVPVIIIGPGNGNFARTFSNLCSSYVPLPVKKSHLLAAVSAVLNVSPAPEAETAVQDGTVSGTAAKPAKGTPPVKKKKSPSGPAAGRKSSPRKKKSSSTAAKKHESERRMATVMFADISGFTAMSEKMDPEEITRIMNLCFKDLGRCIERHGGYIDKFIGDCIMAVFGVPAALENAPLQAVNTAIGLRNRISAFNSENNLQIPLDIHIGINTGMVLSGVVGSDQKMDYTVMGDTVNLASRLEDASERGQILAGAETYKATKTRFEYRELKPVELKGKAEPVPVYELLSTKETEASRLINEKPYDKTSSDRIIFADMVGRSDEMNRLRLHVMKVINGEGAIVNIIGEAGIGKSRLMAELFDEPFMNGVTKLEGRAISIGRNLSYYPVIYLLKKMAGIAEDDSAQNSLAKLDNIIRTVHPSGADEIIPFIATLMGVPLTGKFAERISGVEGEALEILIRKNIRELLRRASDNKPLLICIEDLHWADSSTIDLLESLFSMVRKNRILFINVFRSGYDETSERIRRTISGEYSQYYTEMTLDPLDEKESALLVSKLLKIRGLPQTIRDQVRDRSGGNPFFIEEVVRSLIDDGAIVVKKGRFVKTDRINEFSIPLTINELLMSRIDRLDDDTRELVKTASVIGRNFFRKIILQISENISDIDRRLNYLEDIQMIRERNRLDEIEYLFKHALIQETAYESLLYKKRRELHLQVANAIEKTFSERLNEFYGMLAYHYSLAEDPDKAEEYMLKAGEEAMKSSAGSEAIEYFKRTLKIYREKYSEEADTEKFIPLYRNMAEALHSRGHYAEAIPYFDMVLEYYGFFNSHFGISRIITMIHGFITGLLLVAFPSLLFRKDPPECEIDIFSFNQKKMYALGMIDNRKMVLDGMNAKTYVALYDLSKIKNGVFKFVAISGLYSWMGISFKFSRRVLERAGKMISDAASDFMIIFMYHKAMHESLSGEWGDNTFEEDIIDRGASVGELHCASNYQIFYFCIELEKGNFDNARRAITKISGLAEEYDHDVAKLVSMEMQMYYYYKLRILKDLLDYNDKNSYMSLGESTDFKMGILSVQANRVEAYLLQGDIDRAMELLERMDNAVYGVYQAPFFAHYSYTAHIMTELYLLEQAIERNNRDAVIKHKKNLRILCKKNVKNSTKNYLSRVEALRLAGTFQWLAGSRKKSLKFWRQSIDEGVRLEAILELSRTYFEIGKRLYGINSIPDREIIKVLGLSPEQCLEKAENLFREMDLQWDLGQLEAFRRGMK